LEPARRLGDVVVMSPSWPLLESAADIYRKVALAAGNEPEIVMMRDPWVVDSLQDAARVFGPEVMDAYKYYWRNGANTFHEFSPEDDFQFERIWKACIITGAPETCVTEFKR